LNYVVQRRHLIGRHIASIFKYNANFENPTKYYFYPQYGRNYYQHKSHKLQSLSPVRLRFVRATMADEQVMHFIRPATMIRKLSGGTDGFLAEICLDYPGFGIFMIRLNETGEVAGYCVVRR
jgi:hypothetical protein